MDPDGELTRLVITDHLRIERERAWTADRIRPWQGKIPGATLGDHMTVALSVGVTYNRHPDNEFARAIAMQIA